MIAREVITKCDKCGQSGDDVRTYTLRFDGQVWEADLDEKHVKVVTVAEITKIGRQTESGRRNSASPLERRIRNLPGVVEEA